MRAGLPGLQGLDDLPEPLGLGDGVPVAAAGRAHDALLPALGLLEVGVDQLGLDRLDIAQRVDLALGVHDALVGVGAHHVHDRVGLTDIGQEPVAQSFAAMRARHQAGDVVEGDRVRHDLGGADDLGDRVQPLVGHRDDRHVGFDRGEGVVGGLGGDPGERGEQRGLAGVRHADDPDLHRHRSSPPAASAQRRAESAPATTSLG